MAWLVLDYSSSKNKQNFKVDEMGFLEIMIILSAELQYENSCTLSSTAMLEHCKNTESKK